MTASVCEVDGNTFSHPSSHSHHKNSHSSQEYSCAVCHKAFKSSKTLQVHKKAMTRHDCDQCDQDFTNIGNLRRHVNSAHKKLNFNCAVADCGKVFHRKDVMKKHFTECKSRADEKNEMIQMNLEFSREAKTFSDIFDQFLQDRSIEEFLDCKICDSTFSTKDYLKTHKNKYHSNELDRTWIVYVFIVRNIHLNMVTSFAQKPGRNNTPVCSKNCHFTNF